MDTKNRRFAPARPMSGKTAIEWATMSWNPTTGCSRVSAGCDNCYAFEWHDRRRYVPQLAAAKAAGYKSPVEARAAGAALPFARQYDLPYSKIQLLPQRLRDPDSWSDPELVFVDSMADLMHEDIADSYIGQVFDTMDRVDRHVYLVLTKRPERFPAFVSARYEGRQAPAHIWLGTSVEDDRVLERVDRLRETPATVRFLSCEPLLGSLSSLDLTGIHWLIAGGESGARRRPVDPGWIRELRDMCAASGVAFFFKQWGGFHAKDNGRTIDGRTWQEYPSVAITPSARDRYLRASGELPVTRARASSAARAVVASPG